MGTVLRNIPDRKRLEVGYESSSTRIRMRTRRFERGTLGGRSRMPHDLARARNRDGLVTG
jgi:hypothetical protein